MCVVTSAQVDSILVLPRIDPFLFFQEYISVETAAKVAKLSFADRFNAVDFKTTSVPTRVNLLRYARHNTEGYLGYFLFVLRLRLLCLHQSANSYFYSFLLGSSTRRERESNVLLRYLRRRLKMMIRVHRKHRTIGLSSLEQCPVNVVTRKVCQYCRYTKCTATGMKPKW